MSKLVTWPWRGEGREVGGVERTKGGGGGEDGKENWGYTCNMHMSGVRENYTHTRGVGRERKWICGEVCTYYMCIDIYIYRGVYMCGASEKIMTHSSENAIPRKTPNRETQIPRYTLKWSQNRSLNLYRETPRNLSFSIWWISEMYCYQWNLSYGVARASRLLKL